MTIFRIRDEPIGAIGKEPVVDLPSDVELIGRSIADPAAFAGIFDRHAPPLLSYCTRRLGRADAEDVLAETFRVAFETRDRFDPSRSSALPWLYGIAARLIMKQHRGQGRLRRAVDRLTVVSHARTEVPFDDCLAEHDANTDLLAAVGRAIDELAAIDREVILLYAWEQLSYDEIAEVLGVPVGTVRSRLNRVRSALRELRDRAGKEAGVPFQRAPGGVS